MTMLRDQFLLREDVVFLNHGSFGACPKPVFDRYQAWQREVEAQPVEFLGRRLRGLMAEARTELGAYLGAEPDEVVFFPNVTAALNVVIRSLELREGDEVLTTDHEYGALDRAWRFVCAERGARYVVQPLPVPLRDSEEATEALFAGLTDRTRVLFVSHITSPTAAFLPLERIVTRARELGLMTVVDGAHAPGQVPLDLDRLGVDFYGGNCHKWLCAPKGAGFLYARREVQPMLRPLVVSWGWQPVDPGPSRFVNEQERQGTRDPSAYLSVPAAIRFQAEHDWPAVRARCHGLLREAREAIRELTGLPHLVEGDDWYAQMATLPLPPCDVAELKRRLYDEHRIEIPVPRWNGRPCIRISVQGYNTREDIEALVRALKTLLPSVRS